jgi:hypothetical protein
MTHVVAPCGSGVHEVLSALHPPQMTLRRRVILGGNRVPPKGAREHVEVLRLESPVALRRVIDAPREHVVHCALGKRVLGCWGSRGIGGPIDHGDNLGGLECVDGCFVPIVFHLHFELLTREGESSEIAKRKERTFQTAFNSGCSPLRTWM